MVNAYRDTKSRGILKSRIINSHLLRSAYPILILCMLVVLLPITHETLVKPLFKRETRVVVVNREEVWMPRSESEALIRRMQGVRTYLEWGSGASTLHIAPMATRRAVSIEHDGKRCDMVGKKLGNSPIEYNCIPCPNRNGGDGSYKDFKPYVDRIDTLGEKEWDLVFIDGRARVLCAVKALAYIGPYSAVTIHDFHQTSTVYSAILFFYYVSEKSHAPGNPGIAFLYRKPRFHAFQGNASAVQAIVDTGEEVFKLREDGTVPAVFDNIFPPLQPNRPH